MGMGVWVVLGTALANLGAVAVVWRGVSAILAGRLVPRSTLEDAHRRHEQELARRERDWEARLSGIEAAASAALDVAVQREQHWMAAAEASSQTTDVAVKQLGSLTEQLTGRLDSVVRLVRATMATLPRTPAED